MWLTWANGLTAVRGLLIAPMLATILTGHWSLAAAIFSAAVITDLLDGPLARRLDQASPTGGLLDHATDALFVASGLAALACLGAITPWLPVLVLLAFGQYALDSRALAGAALRTSLIGRNNGIAYYVLLGIVVFREALALHWPADHWISTLAWLLAATTAVSMADRAWTLYRRRNR